MLDVLILVNKSLAVLILTGDAQKSLCVICKNFGWRVKDFLEGNANWCNSFF